MAGTANCLGYQQLSAADLASAVALTIPAGTREAWLQAEAANVRYRLDGTNPTTSTGNIILSGAHQPLVVTLLAGLHAMKLIAESGSPKVNVHYFGTVPSPSA